MGTRENGRSRVCLVCDSIVSSFYIQSSFFPEIVCEEGEGEEEGSSGYCEYTIESVEVGDGQRGGRSVFY